METESIRLVDALFVDISGVDVFNRQTQYFWNQNSFHSEANSIFTFKQTEREEVKRKRGHAAE